MNRFTKLRLMYHYTGTKCKCGNDKKSYRWICLECKDKAIKAGKWQELNEACDKHLELAKQIINNDY